MLSVTLDWIILASESSLQCLNLWRVECNWSGTKLTAKVQRKLSKLHFKNLFQRNLFVFCNSWPNFVEWITWLYKAYHHYKVALGIFGKSPPCAIVPLCHYCAPLASILMSDWHELMLLVSFICQTSNVHSNKYEIWMEGRIFSESMVPHQPHKWSFHWTKLILIWRVICDAHRENDGHWQRWWGVLCFKQTTD